MGMLGVRYSETLHDHWLAYISRSADKAKGTLYNIVKGKIYDALHNRMLCATIKMTLTVVFIVGENSR
jgi:hypothetical protein